MKNEDKTKAELIKELNILRKEREKSVINDITERKQAEKGIWGQVLKYNNTLKDIAEYVGIHYTTVSRAIKIIEGEDEK